MNPKVSIIVPVYNAEKTIARCVDSILKQEFTDFELLLMNDGSTDNSGAICDEYAGRDKRIKVIHKENSGVSDTRNLALDMAKGEFIQFLDADDWIAPYATRILMETAEKYHCDMVITDFYRVSGEHVSHKGAIEREGVLSREEFAAEMMEDPADFYYGVLWNKLYRRDIIEQNRLRMLSDISWCEDFMFNLEYIRYCNVFYALQVPVYYYVKTKGSLASQGMNITKTIKMKLMVFEYYNAFYKQVLTQEEYEKKRVQVYRFLIDIASDGIVAPAILPGTKKLGRERLCSSPVSIQQEDELWEDYYYRKLLDYYLEPYAIIYGLSLDELRIVLYLTFEPKCRSFKELADFLQMSQRHMTVLLQKLSQKKIVTVKKKYEGRQRSAEKQLEIVFLQEAEPIREAIEEVKEKYKAAKMSGLTEEEAAEYTRLTQKIRNNIEQIL